MEFKLLVIAAATYVRNNGKRLLSYLHVLSIVLKLFFHF